MSKQGNNQNVITGPQDTPRLDDTTKSSLADKLDGMLSGEASTEDVELETSSEHEESTQLHEPEANDDVEANEFDEGSDDDGDQETEPAAAADDDAPTLPPAYRRTLLAYNWTDDEIDKATQELGDAFLTTAEKLHQNRNQELAQWSEFGRRVKAQQQGQPAQSDTTPQQPPAQQPTNPQQFPDQFQRIDTDALKQKYGDDQLIEDVVTPVNQVLDQINQVLPHIKQGYQTAQQSEEQVLRKTVDDFFSKPDIQKEAGDLYGPNGQMNEEQLQYRDRVLQEADALAYGAQAQGRPLSVEQALEYAHEIVSAKHRDKLALSKMKKKVKARNRGITNKPTRRPGSARRSEGEKPKDRDELIQRTEQRIKALNG